jgi:hypothetical protein
MSAKKPDETGTPETALSDEQLDSVVGGAYGLRPCFIKSWSTSGDADALSTETLGFAYDKIAVEH